MNRVRLQSLSLVGVVVMISGGLFMFTYKSMQFDILGFLLCLLAAFSSGLRWTMAQMIMQKSKLGLNNPIDMMYYMQPWMLVAILPVALWFGSKFPIDPIHTTSFDYFLLYRRQYNECYYNVHIILIKY